MSMVDYMYKLLYGRRLPTVDGTSAAHHQQTTACSLPGDVLRWRLSRALQHCTVPANLHDVNCRPVSDVTTLMSPCRQTSTSVDFASPSSTSIAERDVSAGIYTDLLAVNIQNGLFADGTTDDHHSDCGPCDAGDTCLISPTVGTLPFTYGPLSLWSSSTPEQLDPAAAAAAAADIKPSCRFSRCYSPTMLDVVGDQDCTAAAVYHQLPLSGLLAAASVDQTSQVMDEFDRDLDAHHMAPSAAYYRHQIVQNAADGPVTAPLPTATYIYHHRHRHHHPNSAASADAFTAEEDPVTLPPFQAALKCCAANGSVGGCCCCGNGSAVTTPTPVMSGESADLLTPWQQVEEFYSVTAGNSSFTCSRSIVYDARYSARWQHRKERQRYFHSNRRLPTTSPYELATICNTSDADATTSGLTTPDESHQLAITDGTRQSEKSHFQPSAGNRNTRKSIAGGRRPVFGMSAASGTGTGNTGSGLLCAVCGDNAACQHYGVRTCEGCKGFFKRTVQKNSKYVCLSGRNCVIDKRRRNRCQYCRFQKCLNVGMVKEVVRRDTLKGRRGRLPSKPKSMLSGRHLQQQQQQQRASEPSSSAAVAHQGFDQHLQSHPVPSQSPPPSFLTALVRAFVNSSPEKSNLDYSQLQSQVGLAAPSIEQTCHAVVERSIEVIVQWAELIPGFGDLCREDRDILLQSSLVELFILRLSYSFIPGDDSITFCDGTVLHCSQCLAGFGAEFYELVTSFSQRLHCRRPTVDLSTLSCIAAMTLFTDRHMLHEPHKVEMLQDTVVVSLRRHCAYRSGVTGNNGGSSRPEAGRLLVAKALDRLVELRTVAFLARNSLSRLVLSQNVGHGDLNFSDSMLGRLCCTFD